MRLPTVSRQGQRLEWEIITSAAGQIVSALGDQTPARESERSMMSVAARVASQRARTDRLGRLPPRAARTPVVGGRTTARPTRRT